MLTSFFSVFLSPVILLLRILCVVLTALLIGLFGILMSGFLNSLYFGGQASVRFVVGEDLFPFCKLKICLIDIVLCLQESSQFQKVPLIYCCSQCLCCWSFILEVASCAHAFKATSQFFFYEIRCGYI